jgi:hypothetical protein
MDLHTDVKVSHINITGWTENNRELRTRIIFELDSDILSINETHLADGKSISIPGYKWFGFNRSQRDINAPKTFGGIGILVKNTL